MRWMSYWELACVQRTITVYPVGQKQGFEEIGAQVTLNSPAFPPSRLLARNNLRIAPAILNPRTRCGAGPRIVRDHLHPLRLA